MSEEGARSQREDARSFTHRRTSVNVGNPAIILHRSYRKPFGDNDADWMLAITKYLKDVNERLLALGQPSKRYEGMGGGHPDAGSIVANQRRHQTIPISVGPVRLTVSVDLYDEFWTSKTIIDFSRADDAPRIDDRLSGLLRDLERLENLIEDRLNSSVLQDNGETVELRHQPPADDADSQVRSICSSVSAEISNIENEIFPTSIISENGTACNSPLDMFADFVGFSLACPTEPKGMQQIPLQLDHGARLPRKKANNVFENIQPTRRIPKDDRKLMRLVDAVWPVALRLNPYRIKAPEIRSQYGYVRLSGEFAISRLNRDRALHVTSLGSPSCPDNEAEYPLSYLMLCPHRASWQIGRMIDRVHSLGVFRLASLFEHEAIDQANDKMRRLIGRLEAGKDSRVIRKEFDDIRTSIDGGLHHRIEWSRHYLKLYESLLRGTTFERVEGYQTYEEFVRRRIGIYFEAIESTSRRFAYLSRLLMEKTNQNTNITSRKLLEFAEMVSFFPVVYYSRDIFIWINDSLINLTGQIIDTSVETFWFLFAFFYAAIAGRNLVGFLKWPGWLPRFRRPFGKRREIGAK